MSSPLKAGVYEIFVTASSVGMRTRMNVTPETTVDSIVEDRVDLLDKHGIPKAPNNLQSLLGA